MSRHRRAPARARSLRRGLLAGVLTAATLAVGPASLAGAGSPAPPTPPTPATLGTLHARFAAATAAADAAYQALTMAEAREGLLRYQVDAAAVRLATAQAGIDARLRAIYETGLPSRWTLLVGGAEPGELAAGAIAEGRATSLDAAQLRRVAAAKEALIALERRAAGDRVVILAHARRVFAAQLAARQVLDTEMHLYAREQARLAALRAEEAALDAQAQATAMASQAALTPAEEAVLAQQAPLVRQLENTPDGALPRGWRPTGQVLSGVASWYGPGFVGHPTSSGAPYNPEAYTCAMLAVPLGTVVHVTAPDGTSVNLLVNDRGPYVKGRIIDLSERAAQVLGVGLAQVSVEVLEPTRA